MQKTIDEIIKLKKEKNAVVLAHYYSRPEIDEVADFISDSMSLIQAAQQVSAQNIIVAGIYFMAENIKLLCPDKKVILPKTEARCPMAEMANLPELRELKRNNPDAKVVCHIESPTKIKAESDICCTDTNVIQVVKSLYAKKIILIPDKNIAEYVQKKVPEKQIIPVDGYCELHNNIIATDGIEFYKKLYPDAMTLANIKCSSAVIDMADFVGSTSEIMQTVQMSPKSKFILATEKGVYERLKKIFPHKEFFLVNRYAICNDMKMTGLDEILSSLITLSPEVEVSQTLTQKASECINNMLKVN